MKKMLLAALVVLPVHAQADANPELSNREAKTAAYIAKRLCDMGLEPKTGIAHSGIVAVSDGGLPFAARARGEYNGQDVGVMHACGHDAHMAMAPGAASVLNSLKDELPGSVMLLFQPAEEGPPAGENRGLFAILNVSVWPSRSEALGVKP